jgi:signal transduction histidine kinase
MLTLLLATSPSAVSFAQNNVYKIDDRLYPIYMRAFTVRSTDRGLAIADTLRTLAILYGDKKAECLAYTIVMQHDYMNLDEEAMAKSVETLKMVSKRNGYMQYYYYGPTMYITLLLNKGHSLLAMQENAKLEKEAMADGSNYGMLTCLKNMGKIQRSRGNHDMAYKYNLEALNYQLQFVPDQDPTLLYRDLADYKRLCHEYDVAMGHIDKALESARTPGARERALQEKCLILYDQKRFDDFKACYAEVLELEEKTHANKMDASYIQMVIENAIIDGDYEKALQLSGKSSRGDGQHLLRSRVYEAKGDYESALREYKLSRHVVDSIVDAVQASDIAELNTQIGNQILREKLRSKEEEAMQLKLKHMQQQAEVDHARAANEQLKISNQQLELAKLRSERKLLDAENDKQRIMLHEEEVKNVLHKRMIIYGAITALVVLSILLYALLRHRVMLHELSRKNNELEIARDEAHSANEMKAVFIHNMSHEIRTPLNSIVGFSDILTTPGLELQEEDAREYCRLIRSNSELLTTLVNELLGLAELESGKYTIVREPVPCNSLCQDAMSTVFYNKPEGVELKFSTDVDDDFMIYTDERRVKQVLINYLTNAEKHTESGSIELRCSRSENPGCITFAVTDTGCGIAPENVGKLFQRFEKLDHFEQGFGLGLSICAAIAERFHGKAMLDTSYTGGARFLFIIPLEVPPTSPDDVAAAVN